ncbi:hypothetical protein BEP19_13705 [Ammoniphilus oxalaticus]|uniref:Uncharacterized protein n=1 Tax=Ammoniphilus oxalaticus TaxID=66863 RepID=A0A419SEB8_9BACL|nr:hypothetical protein [Ammoniphilus oxalaticus]RKD21686.1 hypothetical protein BEP19_13705 [Ammoniphilus oxalaticus]
MSSHHSIHEALEQFRFAVFMGRRPGEVEALLTQEQYVLAYEQQLERDPAKERTLMETYSAPLLPVYKKIMEQTAKMEQLLSGDTTPISFTDEDVLDELYDEVSNLETEAEWEDFKKRIL